MLVCTTSQRINEAGSFKASSSQGLGVLKSSPALKMKAVREGAFKLLSALAHKYQQLDVVCGALIDLLNKQEHVPSVLAELAEYALVRYGDARLVGTSC